MIAIVDYKIGNIGSLMNVFNFLGEVVEVVSDPKLLDKYSAIILPGVGAYDTAMNSLHETGFIDPIKSFVKSGKPILGICLGLQVLCKSSEEGSVMGLGLIDGSIKSLTKLGCRGKVPHVGFNEIKVKVGDSPFLTSSSEKDFYFVHSFALDSVNADGDITLAYTEYEGVEFVCALRYKNIFATQFHPEKSGEAGTRLLSEFIKCSKNV